jgi:hypothetical protein
MLTVDIEKIPFFQDGLRVGIQKGIEKGAKETAFKNAIIMIKEFQLAIDDVVQKLNIKKEELLEYMKNKKEEI